MKILRKITVAMLLTLGLCNASMQAFTSYHLLEKGGRKVLVLGLLHNDPNSSRFAELFIKILNNMAQGVDNPDIKIKITLEGGTNHQPHRIEYHDMIGKNLLLWAENLLESDLFSLTSLDLRHTTKQSQDVTIRGIMGNIGALLKPLQEYLFLDRLVDKRLDMSDLWQKIQATTPGEDSLIISDLLETLTTWESEIETIVSSYSAASPYYECFQRLQADFMQALKEACKIIKDTQLEETDSLKELFAHILTNGKTCPRIGNLRINYTNILVTVFQRNICYRVADIGFLHDILQAESEMELSHILIAGEDHSVAVASWLTDDCGYTCTIGKSRTKKTSSRARTFSPSKKFWMGLIDAIATLAQIELRDQPVTTSTTEACCQHCNKRPNRKIQICSRCKNVRYCSRKCQKADWKRHKKECTPKA